MIYTIDLYFQGTPQAIASYLVIGPEGPFLIETGPATTRPVLLAALAEHGYSPADIQHVLVTHIHFDHAGSAGWWAQQGAKVYVHHVGAKHLIDPSKLIASATRIYGERMEKLWGEILPAPAEQVVLVHDGDVLEVAGVEITAVETPGHAWHHHAFKMGDVAFTGDATGLRLPGYQLVDLPAPPPEFDLETWQNSLDRLQKENFSRIYPTHFGEVADVYDHIERLREVMVLASRFIHNLMDTGLDEAAIVPLFETWTRERAQLAGLPEEIMQRYELANPLYMSVTGIMRYWRKRAEGTLRAG